MQPTIQDPVIRPAEKNDVPRIFAMIGAIAEYEKLTHQLEVTEPVLKESLFSDNPAARALVATVDNHAIGYAIFFYNFSTFIGKKGIYLEDIYVENEYRGKGVGDKLFREVAGIARSEGCSRMEWVALDWNQSAIDFYKSRGASKLEEWRLFRFNRSDLEALSDSQ